MAIVNKTFRIFISSTFSDLTEERNALQKNVFPRLRELCMQHGYRFQAIDLRWGVREESALDQQTMNICLDEVARCQRPPNPNFIVLLGNRYGWQPLPVEIPADEYEEIEQRIKESKDKELVAKWYKRDDNAVPPVYCLQARKVVIEDKPPLEREIDAQAVFGKDRAEVFVGRADMLKKIQDYISEADKHPLAVYGESGTGKSALMAYSLQQSQEKHPDAEVIFRFIGATPESSRGLAYSPDAKLIAIRNTDNSHIKLLNEVSGKEAIILKGHSGFVSASTFSPDGRKIVSCSIEDNKLQLWDVRTEENLITFNGHAAGAFGQTIGIYDCAFSSDGKRIISGSNDMTLRLWDAVTGEELTALFGYCSVINTCSFSHNGNRIAIGDKKGQVLLLSIENVKFSIPFVTPIRIRKYNIKVKNNYPQDSWELIELSSFNAIPGQWDNDIKVTCPECGKQFPVSMKLLNVIHSIQRNANLLPNQSPCLLMPDEGWEDPRLLSECPFCHKPLRFNPFIVDNKK